MPRKPVRVWLARDDDRIKNYVFFSARPSLDKFGMWRTARDEHYLKDACFADFQRVTGYKLKPGECKLVRITIEEC